MAKFHVRLKIQSLELEIDGERQDLPAITSAVQRQVSGMLEAGEIAANGQKSLPPPVDVPDPDASGKGRGSRRRNANRTPTDSAVVPIEFRHDSVKYGNPLQDWSVAQKCIWLLHVIKGITGTAEVSAAQLTATFNQNFKTAGKLHPPHVPRDLGRAKGENPALVGDDRGSWFLTGEGEKQAQQLVQSVLNPSA